jgi:hypothetical protein
VIDGRVFAMRGGLSPDIPVIEKIDLRQRSDAFPAGRLESDFPWSDPDE